MQAELHLKHKESQAAITTLEQLEASGVQNARGMLLLARALRQQGDWRRLQELEPRLRSTRGVPATLADETVAQIYLDRLKAAGDAADAAELQAAWKEAPKSLAQRPDVVVAYARAAMACDDHEEAEIALRHNIERVGMRRPCSPMVNSKRTNRSGRSSAPRAGCPITPRTRPFF